MPMFYLKVNNIVLFAFCLVYYAGRSNEIKSGTIHFHKHAVTKCCRDFPEESMYHQCYNEDAP